MSKNRVQPVIDPATARRYKELDKRRRLLRQSTNHLEISRYLGEFSLAVPSGIKTSKSATNTRQMMGKLNRIDDVVYAALIYWRDSEIDEFLDLVDDYMASIKTIDACHKQHVRKNVGNSASVSGVEYDINELKSLDPYRAKAFNFAKKVRDRMFPPKTEDKKQDSVPPSYPQCF